MSNLSSWPEGTGANELRTQILPRLYSAFYKVSVVLIERRGMTFLYMFMLRQSDKISKMQLYNSNPPIHYQDR